MTWTRACELLQNAVNSLAEEGGKSPDGLKAASVEISELGELRPEGEADASYTADLNERIAAVKKAVGASNAMTLTGAEGAKVASEIVNLASAVRQGAKDWS